MDNRRGKFYISTPLIDDRNESLMKVMGRCIITRCEHLYMNNEFEYYAISPDFDELKLGDMTPVYTVMIDSDLNVTFKRA